MADERDHQLAPAKLTLALKITGVRPDGLHLLDAEMVSLDLADEIWFGPGDSLEVLGAETGGVPPGDSNLVRRALRAVGRTASVKLVKCIPAGGGLGGGSADAAAVLRWAADAEGSRGLDLSLAAGLGADVPFCVVGGRARVRGIGELIQPLPLEKRSFTLLMPPFGVSTARVYAVWDQMGGPTADGPNDLEPAALQVEPRLAAWRDAFGDAAGLQPCLAGSGSTWYVEADDALAGREKLVVAGEAGRLRLVRSEGPE